MFYKVFQKMLHKVFQKLHKVLRKVATRSVLAKHLLQNLPKELVLHLKIHPIKKGFRRSLSLYPEWESNPHARRHTILSRARLPIPPSRHLLSLEECKYKHVFYFPTTALKISRIFPQSIRPKRSTIPTTCAFSRIF